MKSERENCGFEELMVSYIYDEATSVERRRFEGHLLDCVHCTDEFASLSNARLSVFEWQKEDFAELETPRFEIPSAPGRRVQDTELGFFGKLQGIFSGFGMPIAAAAGILIALGLGFAAVTIFNTPEPQIAANLEVNRPVVEQKPTLVEKSVDIPQPTVTAATRENEPSIETDREIAPVRASEIRRAKPSRPTANQTAERRTSPNRPRKAPVLSDFEETDDRSLRLTDLFDGEIGGVY